MTELNARLLDLPAHLRRVIQVEMLRAIESERAHVEIECALDTVRALCGLPNGTGVLIRTPRDLLWACRNNQNGDDWRLLRLGRSKCESVWKVQEYTGKFRHYGEHHYKTFKAPADGISRNQTALILARQLTKKRTPITMAVVERGTITKHACRYSASVSDMSSFTMATMRMLKNVP